MKINYRRVFVFKPIKLNNVFYYRKSFLCLCLNTRFLRCITFQSNQRNCFENTQSSVVNVCWNSMLQPHNVVRTWILNLVSSRQYLRVFFHFPSFAVKKTFFTDRYWIWQIHKQKKKHLFEREPKLFWHCIGHPIWSQS